MFWFRSSTMPVTYVPGALLVRWIGWIRLFDFEVKHVPCKKHTATDRLSRRVATYQEMKEEAEEEDIDDFIDAQLESIRGISCSSIS